MMMMMMRRECDRALSYTHLDHLHLVSDAGWIVLVRSTSLVITGCASFLMLAGLCL